MRPSIIFIDECDAIMGKRDDNAEHMISLKNQLLLEMDGKCW